MTIKPSPDRADRHPASVAREPWPRAVLARFAPHQLDTLRSLVLPLLAGLGVALLLLVFALVASEVFEGDTRGLDAWLLQTAQRYRTAHPRFGEVMRDLSGLGSSVVLSLLVIAAMVYLALLSARRTALLVAASTLSGAALVHLLLKPAFGRARPDLAFADHAAWGMSFPSGHASMSAIVFLTLGALVADTRSRWVERIFILAVAAGAAFLVGMSRVALGVHWATDVLAGWALGAAWATGWLLVAHRARRSERTDAGDGRRG
ncbi:phosphatase PAP2 family protein [Variovorax defluvii]|uniref:Phosphatase PAP2 family protein n=1 Tax=Variovorax defluvii TaxID=913761 RepID=A0ABP8HDW5_9BURK